MLELDRSMYSGFEILTEWAEQYNEDEKSAAVYGGEATHTLESLEE